MIKKILLSVVFGLIFYLSLIEQKVFANCYNVIPSIGCEGGQNKPICPNNNNLCCDTEGECTAKAPATDCDPGAGGVPLGSCLQLSDSSKVQDVYTSPSFLVNLLVDNAFVAAGVLIFFLTLLAGFFFITGGKKGLDQAKQILLAVMVGFGLMLAAYWIVQIIKLITKTDILI